MHPFFKCLFLALILYAGVIALWIWAACERK
jgi:hypothetical protein